MSRLVPFVLGLALVVYALIDCAQSPSAQVRGLRKPWWIAVILLVPLVGAVAWLVAGRPRNRRDGAALPPRPLAPDDDPEFLRRLRPQQQPPRTAPPDNPPPEDGPYRDDERGPGTPA